MIGPHGVRQQGRGPARRTAIGFQSPYGVKFRQCIHLRKVFVDQEYEYHLLSGQIKGDGRGAQANVQLRLNHVIYMNLHVPLFRVETLVEADEDGGGAWSTKVTNKFAHK